MAHPKRVASVEHILAVLDRPACVVWDERGDRHDTGIRALETYDAAATHHLVLQDDVIVPRDLCAGVERAVGHIPADDPMCLYLGRVRPFAQTITRVVQAAGDASWLTMQGIYWGPGIVVPTTDIPAISAWWAGAGARIKNYDRRLSAWYALRDATVWYPWPSLVDHADGHSLVKGHGRGRCAHNFIGADASALDADWTRGVVDVPRSAAMDDARQLRAQRAQRRERVPA